ncbi:Pre-Mrna-Processing Factor 6 [Manis pentadactyla]|nr:Pre-Mrna-Processing Factor 6 [Manis pentadactyla]
MPREKTHIVGKRVKLKCKSQMPPHALQETQEESFAQLPSLARRGQRQGEKRNNSSPKLAKFPEVVFQKHKVTLYKREKVKELLSKFKRLNKETFRL